MRKMKMTGNLSRGMKSALSCLFQSFLFWQSWSSLQPIWFDGTPHTPARLDRCFHTAYTPERSSWSEWSPCE